MHIHLFGHHTSSTNGAPQVVAAGFASLIFFTLLFPFVEVSSLGTTAPANLVSLLKTDAGFNVFVLAVLLVPPIGMAVVTVARSTWRVASMLVAVAGLLVIVLSLLTLNRGIHTVTHGIEMVAPGLGSYILLLGYGVLALATGIVAFRDRHVP